MYPHYPRSFLGLVCNESHLSPQFQLTTDVVRATLSVYELRIMSLLEALQVEIVESIVSFLELRDIASLRLTCRTIEDKASNQSFASFFRDKDVKLTSPALQDFVLATGQGRLGCLLRHCTLTGVVSNKKATASEIDDHSRLLTDAFRNLKNRSPEGGLTSLTLAVAVDVGTDGRLVRPDDVRVRPAWRKVWDVAACTFRETITALQESQMSMGEHLDIFGNVSGCSLTYDVFVAHMGTLTSARVFGSLKTLTLSLSGRYRGLSEPQWEGSPQETTNSIRQTQRRDSAQVLRTVKQLSLVAPQLEDFDLHWYDLGRNISTSTPFNIAQEGDIDTGLGAVHVKSCKLRGVFMSETGLLQFLQAACPATLTMSDIHLGPGTYTSILEYLNSQDSPTKSYHLDDLREGGSLVHFSVPGSSKFTYVNGRVGPSTLTRGECDARETVSYRLPPGRPKGSPKLNRWRESKTRQFGPPVGDGFADVNNSHE